MILLDETIITFKELTNHFCQLSELDVAMNAIRRKLKKLNLKNTFANKICVNETSQSSKRLFIPILVNCKKLGRKKRNIIFEDEMMVYTFPTLESEVELSMVIRLLV